MRAAGACAWGRGERAAVDAPIGDASFAVTVIAVALAVLMSGVVVLLLQRTNRAERRWKVRAKELDRQLGQYDAVFGAYPGLVLVWSDGSDADESDFGAPRVYGSPAALASILRFSNEGRYRDVAMRVLSALADLNTIGETPDSPTLRTLLGKLRRKGEPFAVSIVLPGGNVIEADGTVAGRQLVLWLEDASIRGEDERTAISRFETSRLTAEIEPVAFVEMMGRAPFPMWRLSGSGDINWANPAYVRAVGGTDLRDVLDRQLHLDATARDDIAAVLRSGRPQSAERPITVADGRRLAMQVELFPVSGGVAGLAVDASELDALRRANLARTKAQKDLLDSMGEAVASFGPDQRLRSFNTAFARMFDLDEAMLAEQPSHGAILDILRESDQLEPHADYRSWKARELALYTQWPDEVPDETWTLSDGRILRCAHMRDAEGGLSLLFADTTDRMILKSQLGTLINVQRATLDKLAEGISVFGTDGRLRLHNAAFARLWNLPEHALEDGPRFAEIAERCLPLYHDAAFWADLKARATDPNPDVRQQVDGEIQRSDDRVLRWLSRPLPDGATLVAWDDITASRQTEKALRERAEALEEADRMKSEFVGHVSYQLRTPLTTIAGYSDFLQNGVPGELNDKQSEYVFAIQSASEDLAKAIDDILDIAAIEADKLDLELGDVDVFRLLDGAMDYVTTKADDTRITLELACAPDIGRIRADETRMKQVVYNLLTNALRFTKPGGLIELGASRAPGGGVKIWVRDTGVGIPLERQSQVFESFESSRGGVGLGLTLVQRIIERHGGWVELDSVEGQGTHVSCYLPKEASTAGAHPELFETAE